MLMTALWEGGYVLFTVLLNNNNHVDTRCNTGHNLYNSLFMFFFLSRRLFSLTQSCLSVLQNHSLLVFAKYSSDSCFFLPTFFFPVRNRPDIEDAPAAKEDQSESTQSDSDDCIVHSEATGRKVSETSPSVYPPHNWEKTLDRACRHCAGLEQKGCINDFLGGIVVLLSCTHPERAEQRWTHVLIAEWFVKVFCFGWASVRFYPVNKQDVVSEYGLSLSHWSVC